MVKHLMLTTLVLSFASVWASNDVRSESLEGPKRQDSTVENDHDVTDMSSDSMLRDEDKLEVGPHDFRCPPAVGNGIRRDDAFALPLHGSTDQYQPMYHRRIGKKSPRYAFIQLHGALLDGHFYFKQMLMTVKKVVPAGKSAVVVTPVFGDRDCKRSMWMNKWDLNGTNAKWANRTANDEAVWPWHMGGRSDHRDGFKPISTFEVLDEVVDWLDKRYKKLKRIVISSFSSGSQLSLRWAVMSRNGAHGKTAKGTHMQYIIGSPSSVIYLDADRPKKDCVPLYNTGPTYRCSGYEQPGPARRAPASCHRTWDNYPQGLRHVDRYIGADYVGDTSRKEIQSRFASKDVWLGVGDGDTTLCNVGACQRDCGAMVQGSSRLQRMLNFEVHLKDVLPGYTPRFQVFQGGHAYHHMLWGETFKPKMSTSYFMNAFKNWTSEATFSCSSTIKTNLGLNGDVLGQKEAAKPQKCCWFCDANPRCKAWSFAAKWKQCSLLSDARGSWITSDFVSGFKNEDALSNASSTASAFVV